MAKFDKSDSFGGKTWISDTFRQKYGFQAGLGPSFDTHGSDRGDEYSRPSKMIKIKKTLEAIHSRPDEKQRSQQYLVKPSRPITPKNPPQAFGLSEVFLKNSLKIPGKSYSKIGDRSIKSRQSSRLVGGSNAKTSLRGNTSIPGMSMMLGGAHSSAQALLSNIFPQNSCSVSRVAKGDNKQRSCFIGNSTQKDKKPKSTARGKGFSILKDLGIKIEKHSKKNDHSRSNFLYVTTQSKSKSRSRSKGKDRSAVVETSQVVKKKKKKKNKSDKLSLNQNLSVHQLYQKLIGSKSNSIMAGLNRKNSQISFSSGKTPTEKETVLKRLPKNTKNEGSIGEIIAAPRTKKLITILRSNKKNHFGSLEHRSDNKPKGSLVKESTKLFSRVFSGSKQPESLSSVRKRIRNPSCQDLLKHDRVTSFHSNKLKRKKLLKRHVSCGINTDDHSSLKTTTFGGRIRRKYPILSLHKVKDLGKLKKRITSSREYCSHMKGSTKEALRRDSSVNVRPSSEYKVPRKEAPKASKASFEGFNHTETLKKGPSETVQTVRTVPSRNLEVPLPLLDVSLGCKEENIQVQTEGKNLSASGKTVENKPVCIVGEGANQVKSQAMTLIKRSSEQLDIGGEPTDDKESILQTIRSLQPSNLQFIHRPV